MKITDVQRIAVLRALQLGDLLVAVPAVRALRLAYPQAEITLIGLPWASSLVARYSTYLDRFVAFPGAPGIAEADYDPARTDAFLKEQRVYGYDLVIQMHGSGETSNPFALALGAPHTAGYYRGAPPVGLDVAAPYPEAGHEIWRWLRLVELLGARDLSSALEFPLYANDEAEADRLLARLPAGDGPVIGLHAGARPSARRWPAAHFAALADLLADRFGARIVLTGAANEAATVAAVAIGMRRARPLSLVGATSLGGLAALIARLDLFIGNDTGPAHLACAVGTTSITLFGPADPHRWAPLDRSRHPILRRPVACSPCGYTDCPIDHRCLTRISPDRVFAQAERLLSTHSLMMVGEYLPAPHDDEYPQRKEAPCDV